MRDMTLTSTVCAIALCVVVLHSRSTSEVIDHSGFDLGSGNFGYIFTSPDVPPALRTFYVDAETGHDTADGLTPGSAWHTLQRANKVAQPGDRFLLRGTFRGQRLRPAASGTATHKIVYAAGDGPTPVLDAEGLEAMVQLDSLSHVVLDGLELTGGEYIVQLWGKASHIWLRNLYVHDSGGVLMKASSYNRVEDCRFERIGS
jgi:hypothetical protein